MRRSINVDGIKNNFIDKAISAVFPLWGYRRSAARFAREHLLSSYRGARTDRPREKWIPGGGSADEDLLLDLSNLRERSRDLNKNNGVASGATNVLVNNVVGCGLMPQSQINADALKLSPDQALEIQCQMETAYSRWKINADSTNRLDFDDIQALVQRQILENGDICLLPLMLENRRPYSLALELIEADRLDSPFGHSSTDKDIRGGIELGSRGQPAAYWFKKTHPGDTTIGARRIDDWNRIPAWNSMGRRNVIHLYHQLRPEQNRGVPWFAPALEIFKDMAEYMESELVAARVAACFAILVTSANPYDMGGNNSGGEVDSDNKPVEYLEPGMIKYMKRGDDVTGFSPNRPGNTFEPFIERILRMIGVALDMPYELIAKDFSQTNYSSARASLLEARRFFESRQIWLSRKLCQPVWEMVMEEAWLRGEINAPDFLDNKREYCKALWIPNGWRWIDPYKEAQANKVELECGTETLTDIWKAKGKDFEEQMEKRAKELKKIRTLEKDYGVTFFAANSGDENKELIDGNKNEE